MQPDENQSQSGSSCFHHACKPLIDIITHIKQFRREFCEVEESKLKLSKCRSKQEQLIEEYNEVDYLKYLVYGINSLRFYTMTRNVIINAIDSKIYLLAIWSTFIFNNALTYIGSKYKNATMMRISHHLMSMQLIYLIFNFEKRSLIDQFS